MRIIVPLVMLLGLLLVAAVVATKEDIEQAKGGAKKSTEKIEEVTSGI